MSGNPRQEKERKPTLPSLACFRVRLQNQDDAQGDEEGE